MIYDHDSALADSTNPLRSPDFLRLAVTAVATETSTVVRTISMPLLAATALATTPFQQGLVVASGTAAFLFMSLPAGAWVDRLSCRRVMIVTNAGRGLLLASIPLAACFAVLSFPQVLVVGLLVGCLTTFFNAASPGLTVAVVGREHLASAHARMYTLKAAGRLGAPGLAGVVAEAASAVAAVGVSSAGYACSLLMTARIKVSERPIAGASHSGLIAEMVDGLRFTFGHPILRAIAGFGATHNFFVNVSAALHVLFLARTLDQSAGAVGLIIAVGGLGGIVGAATSQWWSRRFGRVRMMLASTLVCSPAALLVPLADSGWRLGLFVAGSAMLGYGVAVSSVNQLTLRQTVCPDRLMARVSSSSSLLTGGMMPLGALAGGVLGQAFGVRAALWVGAAGILVAPLWFVSRPLRGLRDLPAAASVNSDKSYR